MTSCNILIIITILLINLIKSDNLDLKECMDKFKTIQKTPFETNNCCLIKMCSNHCVTNNRRESELLLHKLCNEKLYLMKEKLSGCVYQNNEGNKERTFIAAATDANPRIANCSANFKVAAINSGNTTLQNTNIITELQNSSYKRLTTIQAKIYSKKVRKNTKMYLMRPLNESEENFNETSTMTDNAKRLSLQFLDVPRGDDLHVYELKLNEEYLLFELFSHLIGYLQPDGFPSELVREALSNKTKLHLVMFRLLKMESYGIGWILLWAILSLCLPTAVIAHYCCPNKTIERLNEDSSDISIDFRDKCTKSALVSLLHLCIVFLLIPIILILAANEQISRTMGNAVQTTNIVYEDISTFIENSHMQISFVATSSIDITIEAIRKDLEESKEVLGKPFQKELAAETGIDIALNALDDLKIATAKVTSLVSDLLNECATARELGVSLQEKLSDITRQLTIARQQCSNKDRTLCYTLQAAGFDLAFSVDNFTEDLKIKHLDRIGKENKFNASMENARKTFEQIPDRVSLETVSQIAGIKSVLSKKRTEVYKSAHGLDVLARSLYESVRINREYVVPNVGYLADWDIWRWLTVLLVCTLVSLVWGLLLCGAPCGCGLSVRTIPVLLSGVCISCLTSLILWSLGTVAFLLGTHGQTLVCQPLYDQPHYSILGEMFDSGGILYNRTCFFNDFIKGNDTLALQDVLKNCQRNQPVYTTFHLYNMLDVDVIANYETWEDLRNLLKNFTVGTSNLELLSPSLQLNLQVLSTVSSVNLTVYRGNVMGSVTRRDLNSFADQLNTVARQLTDLDSSKRIDNLAFVTRKLVQDHVNKLREIKDSILYKMTALEVLMYPLNKQVNQSLSHLKTIQYFLDNQGWQIAEKNNKEFTSRIENYLKQFYQHVKHQLTNEIGRCRPLWDIFHSARFSLCKLIVDPINGLSCASYLIILLFIATCPVVIKLVEHYKEINERLFSSVTHRRAREGIFIDEEGTWATPQSESPPDIALRGNTNGEQATWVSPGPSQSSELLIPVPPRQPSNISARIPSPRLPPVPTMSRPRVKSPRRFAAFTSRLTSARVPQLSSETRARSPKRGHQESLKLIDPIAGKLEPYHPEAGFKN